MSRVAGVSHYFGISWPSLNLKVPQLAVHFLLFNPEPTAYIWGLNKSNLKSPATSSFDMLIHRSLKLSTYARSSRCVKNPQKR